VDYLRQRDHTPEHHIWSKGSDMAERLGLDEARIIVDTMLAEGKKRGLNFAGAVTDAGGDLIHLSRMDDASALNARMSFHKAYTAVKWKRNTRVIQDNLFAMSLGDDRREISWFCDPMYTPVWGGILLKSSAGAILGALGQSGGTKEQDEEIGQIAAKVFAEM
jgi:glc operon protein GlcG